MSLSSQLNNFAVRLGTEFKSVRASIGTLASLSTTEKASLVGAINEIKAGVEAGGNITADAITDATAVGKSVLKAANAGAARTAIGAGTSNLVVGTAATDAKAGNYIPTWGEVSGKPVVIASGADQAAARTSIGAGTSSLIIGTTGTTAKAGNYAPAWSEVTSKPAVIAAGADATAARTAIGAGTSSLAIGTTAGTAKAGDYAPTWTDVSGKPAVIASGVDVAAARGVISVSSTAEMNAAISTAVTNLINGAPVAYDTLKEIADYIAGNDTAVGGITTALANRVRVDAVQAFTEPQKLQARSNIDVFSKVEIGSITTDFVATFEAALV